MKSDRYGDPEDLGDDPSADWPPGKPGRPYGVHPTPPGLVRANGQPPDLGTVKPAANPATTQPVAATPTAPPTAADAAPPPSPQPPIPLLRRQERFCQFFAVTGNATESARQAGYSIPTSRNQAYRLLRRPEVQARVAELQRGLARAVNLDAEVMLGKLESVYRQAIEARYFNAAARVVEMQARIAGHLRRAAMPPPAPPAPEKAAKRRRMTTNDDR